MHYLGLALYAEGRTDYYFLRPLLLRLCEDICLNEANQAVEFGEEVIGLNDAGSTERRAPRAADCRSRSRSTRSLAYPFHPHGWCRQCRTSARNVYSAGN